MKQKLIIAAALASVFMASPVQAQSLGDFLGSLLEDEDLFKKQPKVEDMGSVCQQSSLAYWFAFFKNE